MFGRGARASAAIARATSSAPTASAPRIGGDVEAGHSARPFAAATSASIFASFEPRHGLAVDQRRGGKRAMPKAIDCLYRERAGPCASTISPCSSAKMRDQPLDARRLARFGAANLHHRRLDRGRAKIVVETDDADGFGFGDVERVGDQGDRLAVDVAEVALQIVEDGQHRAGLVAPRFDQAARPLGIPGRPLSVT